MADDLDDFEPPEYDGIDDLKEADVVYDIYEDGTAAIYHDLQHYVYTADGELMPVGWNLHYRLYAGLRALIGDIPLLDDRDIVPVVVAADGKPAMATYLFAVHREYYIDEGWWGDSPGRTELAEQLDVTPKTVQKYISRTARRIDEKRIGGRGGPFQIF